MANTPINKTLMKRLIFEYLEEIVRLEARIDALQDTASKSLAPYLNVLQDTLATIKAPFYTNRASFLKLFSDDAVDDPILKSGVDSFFQDIQARLSALQDSVFAVHPMPIQPETELFLSSLQLDKLLPDVPQLLILPAQQAEASIHAPASDALLLSHLSLTAVKNPLAWLSVLNTFTHRFCMQTLQVNALLEELHLPDAQADLIISPLLNLRLLGPGYYAHYVFNAFKAQDAIALNIVEPFLFQALNRFGLVNKDMVILHQSVEREKQQSALLKESKTLAKALNNEELREKVLKVVEKVIPEKLAFSEKSLGRSQLLEERLSNGILISAVPMFSSPAQLRDDLAHLEDGDTMYPLLHQLQESPATPREIINAGWLYKLDQSSDWLQSALEDGPIEGWNQLKQHILSLDILLLKSIEISEVHRIIARDESDYLVSV